MGAGFIRHRYALGLGAVLAAFALVTEQVVRSGPLVRLDYAVHDRRVDLHYPHAYDAMYYLVMIGQRGLALAPALVAAALLARRVRSWRPVVVLGLAVLALNLLVGAGKLYTERPKPADGSAAVFVPGGIIFPSGHAANVVLTWGLLAYLLVQYGPVRRVAPGMALTALAALIVGVASVYLDTHWVSDILAGWLAGTAVLVATVWADRSYRPLARSRGSDPAAVEREHRRLRVGVGPDR